ncbi:hypothetical protein LIX60_20545 [Streptomyces sp. S07_1.15]|uniref:hypothetical protein n=1 Tax=Streptomyces sp. S07_1.15 TaxID=2873925 RepID=UPI001D1538BB|nr:hypothetical protein [Streptomyces sp. S07_1.15]MCC3653804.1 hypothetical protein [Streptomyces sp. S07_1.15]
MGPGTTAVRSWAEAILRQLGDPAGHTLEVTGGAPDEPGAPEPGPAAFTSRLRLRPDESRTDDGGGSDDGEPANDGDPGGGRAPGTGAGAEENAGPGGGEHGASPVAVTLAFRDGSAVEVLLGEGLSEAEAVALLAGQLQEAVLEAAGGAPVPPCPVRGHGHPPVAEVVDGTASWVCPRGGGTRPVLPAPGSRPATRAGGGTGT